MGVFSLFPKWPYVLKNYLKWDIEYTAEEYLEILMWWHEKKRGVDNLFFIITATIKDSKYLGRELWWTFYGTEKCVIVYGLRTV